MRRSLSPTGRANIVVTTDLLTDGVDFHLGKDDPRRIGRQALAANLSDLAAMAARPLAAFISLALPRQPAVGRHAARTGNRPLRRPAAARSRVRRRHRRRRHEHLRRPARDQRHAARRSQPTAARSRAPAAKPGDWLLVTGSLGGSILGHMFDFTPRVREAMLLHERYELHAGIDISDGLALDASRLAEASGCGAVLSLDRVPIAQPPTSLRDARTAQRRSQRSRIAPRPRRRPRLRATPRRTPSEAAKQSCAISRSIARSPTSAN